MPKKGEFNNRVGERHITNQGYIVEIIEYINSANITVVFEDGSIYKNKTYEEILNGRVANKNHRSLYSIGYFGIGVYKSRYRGKITKAYNTWRGMLERCYDNKYQEKKPTYINCSVDEKWHSFQVFAEWFYKNKYDSEEKQNWQLDKDILVKGNKSYSSETCCFVPQEINTLFVSNNMNRGLLPIGVTKVKNRFVAQANIGDGGKTIGYFNTIEEAFKAYKRAKENYIKEVADKWKHLIDGRAYQALYNYQVEITD